MARLSPQGKFRALDSNGDPLAGGKLSTFEAGTSTPKITFTTADESTANDNPIILDADGFADVWLGSGSYKFVLDSSTDVNQWTVDDILGGGATGYVSTVIEQAVNLSITTANQNNLIVCTAAITLSLLAAATAQEGFAFVAQNTSAGDVTIDPDGAELINSASTLIIPAGYSSTIVCEGSKWFAFGITPTSIGAIGDVTLTSAVAGDRLEYNGTGWVNVSNSTQFKASRTATQAIVTATITKVQFNVEDFDPLSDYDAVTNYRYTPSIKGRYMYVAKGAFASIVSTVASSIRIRKNGTTVDFFENAGGGGNEETLSLSGVVDMNGTSDFLEIFVYHESGSNRDFASPSTGTDSSTAGCNFQAFKI